MTLVPELRDRVLTRLGFERVPEADVAGLRAVYQAWCEHVPFDNVWKVIALSRGAPLPGIEESDFFEHWLTHGAGGTCWPTSNALFELVRSLGFRTRRLVAAMRDLGVENHASVAVACDGSDWLVDSSMLTGAPLPLGRRVFVQADPVFPVEVEPVDGTHVVWWQTPPNSTALPCRLSVRPVGHEDYRAGFEASRARSPFNHGLYARRNRGEELLVVVGHTRFSRTRTGLEARDLSRGEVLTSLSGEFGLSAALVEEWKQAGGLEASFRPAEGPKPPPVVGVPPSRRDAI